MSKFDPSLRRKAQCARLLDLDSDIILMQECQKTELDLLMSEDEGVLMAKYEVEFCPFPLAFWSNWLSDASNFQPCENGVCVLTKRTSIHKSKAQHVPIDLPAWEEQLPRHSLGAKACLVYATVPSWGDAKILIVTSHLDADSVVRAGLQGVELAKQVKKIADSVDDVYTTIWGGDFNMEMRCSAMKAIQAEGFKLASGALGTPSVFAVQATVRVDHILCYSKQEANANIRHFSSSSSPAATFVPQCPQGHMINVLPFLSEICWLKCTLRGEHGFCLAVLASLLLLILFPLTLALSLPLLIHFIDRNRQCERLSWALAEWGSDHLPVTVCLQQDGPAAPSLPSLFGSNSRIHSVGKKHLQISTITPEFRRKATVLH